MVNGISQLADMKKNNIRIAVIIADMLELSESSIEIHKKLGTYINKLDFIGAKDRMFKRSFPGIKYIPCPTDS